MPDVESQRASYRCPVQESREAWLTIDGRDVPVELLDESADGLGLALDGRLDCYVGQSATLQTPAERIAVRIMNVQVIAPDTADETGEPAGVRTRLGLRRLNELPVEQLEDHPIQALLRSGFASLRRRFMSLENPLLTVGVPVATILLLVFGLVWALESQRAGVALIKRDLPAGTDGDASHPSRRTDRPIPPTTREQDNAAPTPAATHQPTEMVPTHPATRHPTVNEPTIPHHVLRWSHPGLLSEPEIAVLLALTRQQLERLRELGTAGTDERDRHALGKAALEILRTDQRKQWMSIVTSAHHRASRGISAATNDEDSSHSADSPFASDAEAHRLIKAEALQPARRAP
jgi:hypothetical protein